MLRYIAGIAAGILAGIVFAGSSLFQKKAVNTVAPGVPLFRRLIRSPVWIIALLSAFVIGAPLNMAAYVAIGPTLPPALAAIGLAALPFAARLILKEQSKPRGYAGAVMIAAGIALLGMTGFSVRTEAIDWLDPGLLIRAAFYFGGITVCIVFSLIMGKAVIKAAGVAFALAAGFAQSFVNVLMAPIAGQIGALLASGYGLKKILIAGAASLILVVVNLLAVALSQVALRHGNVTNAAPMQQVPVQLVPLVLHFGLYSSSIGDWRIIPPLVLGVVLLLSGLAALGDTRHLSRV